MYRNRNALTWTISVVFVLGLALAEGACAGENGLVGWWKFDEGSGTIARDSSGNGYDGTLQGGPQWVTGVLGSALRFSGTNSVNCGSAAKAALTQTVSITFWVNPSDLSVTHALTGYAADRIGYSLKSFSTHLRLTTPSVRDHDGANSLVQLNTWQHVAVTFAASKTGGCVFYINGVVTDTLDSSAIPAGAGTVEIGHNYLNQYYLGMIDDVRIFDHVLTLKEVQDAMRGQTPGVAANPHPANQATDVAVDFAFAWTPGPYAALHDVYLGTTFDDVNNATPAMPAGRLVSQGQSDATYDPPGRLDFGTTYYWRIDEVNAPPDSTIFKGTTWSFTTEPQTYPVDGRTIKATASSAEPGQGPQNTVNGSGLTADLHAIDATAMWLTALNATGTAWIQYEFDRVLKLGSLWIWNQNGNLEAALGLGSREVVIEYSTNGTQYQTLGTTYQFARGPGAPGYAHNTTVDLGGMAAKYVKLTIQSNWGGVLKQYGLSEVRFFSVPVLAREPSPPSRATNVVVEATLSWRAGREAASHQVFLGTDPNNLTLAATVPTPTYQPQLNLDQAYYWKIVEVNQAQTPATWPGDVWSFSTQPYVVIDDFESYTDDEGKAIFQTWADGLENPANGGSQVGNDPPPYAEQTNIHAGKQAMPLFYNNTAGAAYSETTRTFDTPQDWTAHGIKSLSLWFRGVAGNTGQLYVKINGTKIPYSGPAANLAVSIWQVWNIDLSQAGKCNSVRTMTIGIEGTGAKGVLYFDDIRLYPKMPEYVTPAAPDTAGLQARYQFEGNANDSSGKGRNGTVQGGATFDAGQTGQALRLDGVDDTVTVPGYKGILATAGVQHAFTVSAWVKTATAGMDIIAWGTNASGQRLNFRIDTPGVLRVEHAGGNILGTGPSLVDDTWHHVAATVPEGGTMMDVLLYVDGRDVSGVGSSTTAFNLKANVDVTIGSGGSATGRFFQGLIDDARIYDRVLSAGEMAGMAGLTAPYDRSF